MTGAQILIEALLEQGVDVVFGYPGGTALNIYDALYEYSDRIRHILTSHEQGAAHAADGYARSTGKVGVCIATSGPGATNLVTGIATAFMDSVPIVAITANVAQALIGRDTFQEIDITGVTMPITKHNFFVKDINDLAETVREAFEIASQGRPGPVLIDIPKDITAQTAEYIKGIAGQKTPAKKAKTEALKKAAEMIAKSEKPLIYSGGGVVFSDSSKQLAQFIEKLSIPACFSMMGLSALPYSHPRNLGMVGMHGTPVANKATTECDLLIAVGARFSDRVAGNRTSFAKHAKIIHIDIDSSEHGKNVRCDLAVEGDAGQVLSALSEMLPAMQHQEWNQMLANYKAMNRLPHFAKNGNLNMRDVVKTVSATLREDAIIVTDVGQHQMITAQNYEFKVPRTFVSSCGLGTMGYGMGAAIGAKVGNPDRQVVLMTGDGCFHMNMNELATAVTENIPIVIILFNNTVLGMVRQWQRLFYKSRYSNTCLQRHTDFIKLAEAFGALGFKAQDKESLKVSLDKALASGAPCIIECAIDKDDSVFPIIPPGGEVSDMIFCD